MWNLLLALALSAAPADPVSAYVEKYFEIYPGRATEAGRHDRDRALEDLTPERLAAWIDFNRRTLEALRKLPSSTAEPERLDAELLGSEIEWQLFQLETMKRPARDPLFWTGIAGNATVFLLVREDRPQAERLAAARARVRDLPRFCRQAREALSKTPPAEIAPDFARIAAGQARASAQFYREGFAGLFAGEENAAVSKEIGRSGRGARRARGLLRRAFAPLDRLAAPRSALPRGPRASRRDSPTPTRCSRGRWPTSRRRGRRPRHTAGRSGGRSSRARRRRPPIATCSRSSSSGSRPTGRRRSRSSSPTTASRSRISTISSARTRSSRFPTRSRSTSTAPPASSSARPSAASTPRGRTRRTPKTLLVPADASGFGGARREGRVLPRLQPPLQRDDHAARDPAGPLPAVEGRGAPPAQGPRALSRRRLRRRVGDLLRAADARPRMGRAARPAGAPEEADGEHRASDRGRARAHEGDAA